MLDFIKSFQISRKMSLTSNLSFKDWYISWVIDNNQFIQESPNHLVINQISLKTLCHSWWNIHTCYFILTFSCIMLKNSQTLCMKGSKAQDLSTNSEWKQVGDFWNSASQLFLCTGTFAWGSSSWFRKQICYWVSKCECFSHHDHKLC